MDLNQFGAQKSSFQSQSVCMCLCVCLCVCVCEVSSTEKMFYFPDYGWAFKKSPVMCKIDQLQVAECLLPSAPVPDVSRQVPVASKLILCVCVCVWVCFVCFVCVYVCFVCFVCVCVCVCVCVVVVWTYLLINLENMLLVFWSHPCTAKKYEMFEDHYVMWVIVIVIVI